MRFTGTVEVRSLSGVEVREKEPRGHTLLYRSGSDSRVDRWNIALLKRIAAKSTTPITLEIYYHESGKLLDWAESTPYCRYIRLRSGEDFPLAERIAQATSNSVVVFDQRLLLSAGDVWRILNLSARNGIVVLDAVRCARVPGETLIAFLWKAARGALKRYLYPQGAAKGFAVAVNKNFLQWRSATFSVSLREKISYLEIIRSHFAPEVEPMVVCGESRIAYTKEKFELLGTLRGTILALGIWRHEKRLPHWFSQNFFVFHVAQLAAYCAALTALIAPATGLLVMAFAALFTPRFFFGKLPWRKPERAIAQMATRLLLYFAG